MKIELPSGYYLSNFTHLIDHVYKQYSDLLTSEERCFYNHFYMLKEDTQKLFVRMMSRKGHNFRLSKLRYSEIASAEKSANELASRQFISINKEFRIRDILPLFNRKECLDIAKKNGFHINKKVKENTLKRTELDDLLIGFFEQIGNSIKLEEPIYTLLHTSTFDIIKLLFFGNPNQDLTEFVLRDLGLYQYEEYRIDKDTRFFENRAQIETHVDFFDLTDQLTEMLKDGALSQDGDTLHAFSLNVSDEIKAEPSLQRHLHRFYFRVGRQLERIDQLEYAEHVYRLSPLSDTRQRLARVLVKRDKIDEALSLCRSIIDAPLNEEESVFARDFAFRTAKKHGLPWTQVNHYRPEEETIFLVKSDNVETTAQKYFSPLGGCRYIENSLFCSIFGLHYWELIFAPVKGAFTHPFQYRPHDFYHHDFLEKRSEKYREALLRMKDSAAFRKDIFGKWHIKKNLASPFVYWRNLDLPLLELALDRIPLRHWEAIFTRIWSDLRANCSGFPDLILFPDSGGYELIEIKGPGDRLQKNQIRWMQCFNENNIPHRVCHVIWE